MLGRKQSETELLCNLRCTILYWIGTKKNPTLRILLEPVERSGAHYSPTWHLSQFSTEHIYKKLKLTLLPSPNPFNKPDF